MRKSVFNYMSLIRSFCTSSSMASNILDSTGHFLETNLDNCTSVHDRMLLESDISSSTRYLKF